MATVLRAQVSLGNAGDVPRDVVQNTWHFFSAGTRATDAGDAVNMLRDFYSAIDGLLSASLSGDMTTKVYDLLDPSPRAPFLTDDAPGFLTVAATKLPNEVAICLSYAGAPASGVPLGRRRGRIFLGPFGTAVLDSVIGDCAVDSGVMGAIASAGEAVVDAGDPFGARWIVFSPTTAGAEPWNLTELTAGSFPVIGGYVDNAFDTVRSRGVAPTARENF